MLYGQHFLAGYVGDCEHRGIYKHTAAGAELGTSCWKLTNAAKSQAPSSICSSNEVTAVDL